MEHADSHKRRAQVVWVVSLVLLVVNDHFFKGHTAVPGWLTGKLSDFAGLVVAPVLLARVFSVRTLSAKAACMAFVVLPFVAINLSEPCARQVEQAMAPFRWRIWSDPSDLVALAVLPITWWVLGGWTVSGSTERSRKWPTARERIALILASLACLATGADFFAYRTSVFVHYREPDTVNVHVYRLADAVDCTAISEDPTLLQNATYSFEFCDEAEVLPLSSDWTRNRSDRREGPGGAAPPCDAVVLAGDGWEPTLVWWGNLPRIEVEGHPDPRPYDDDAARDHGVYLERAGPRVFLTVTDAKEEGPKLAPFTGTLPEFERAQTRKCPPGSSLDEVYGVEDTSTGSDP